MLRNVDDDEARFINRFCNGAALPAAPVFLGLSDLRLLAFRLGIPSGVDDRLLDRDEDESDEERPPRRPLLFLLLLDRGLLDRDRLDELREDDLDEPEE